MAISSRVTVTGLDEVLRKLSAFGDMTLQASASALYEEARAVEAVSGTGIFHRFVPSVSPVTAVLR